MAQINQAYGKYQNGFELNFYDNGTPTDSIPETGLFVFHGKNSSGKTTVLKAVARHISNYHDVLYIPAERTGIDIKSSQLNGTLIEEALVLFQNLVSSQDREPVNWRLYSERLAAAIFSEEDDVQKVHFKTNIEKLFGIKYKSTQSVWQTEGQQTISSDGSGIKAAYFVLAALSTNSCPTIVIDEPELSLESKLQKKLFALLIEKAKTHRVIIATHSPHFINRAQPTNNFIVESGATHPTFITPSDDEELYKKIIVDKVGFSLSDIFLPEKIVIVEGECDRVILNSILNALKITNVFVHKIGGISNYENVEIRVKAIEESVSPHLRGDELYLYKGKVALLTDYLDPNEDSQNKLRLKLVSCFNDYWYQITDKKSTGADILLAIPEECYSAAALSKTDYVDELESLRARGSTYSVIASYKNDTANKLAAAIEPDNVSSLLAIQGITKVIDFIQR